MKPQRLILVLLGCVQWTHAKMKCGPDEFACLTGDQCIPKRSFCDLQANCDDFSDEYSFEPSHAELEGVVSCKSWTDISMDCALPKDYDEDTYCNKNAECPEGTFKCSDGDACIHKTFFCDGTRYCNDNSDEVLYDPALHDPKQKCRGWLDLSRICAIPLDQVDSGLCNTESVCDAGYFRCNHGQACIGGRDFCNGQQECSDGSDEIPYEGTGTLCLDCLLPKKYNASFKDICLIDCLASAFKCSDSSRCIARSRFCDGKKDCRDGSDEISYKHEGEPCESWEILGKQCRIQPKNGNASAICNKYGLCKDGFYQCRDRKQCIEEQKFCDGKIDCKDESDETVYEGSTFKRSDGFPCVSDEYHKKCVLAPNNEQTKDRFCNLYVCTPKDFVCENGIQCLLSDEICDGIPGCSDGSDEIPFNASVHDANQKCQSWSRINEYCALPLDPLNGASNRVSSLCRPEGDVSCRDDEFRCADGSRCIHNSLFCNGDVECLDGSDEKVDGKGINCRSPYVDKICKLPKNYDVKHFCFDVNKCKKDQFICNDETQCFDREAFCDGVEDCRDGSDEIEFRYSGRPHAKVQICESWKTLNKVCLLPIGQKKQNICNTRALCPLNSYKCTDAKKCVVGTKFCDGNKDCQDGSDEIRFKYSISSKKGEACKNPISGLTCLMPSNHLQSAYGLCEDPCHVHEYKCKNGDCIPKTWFCDEEDDCSDGSDEIEFDKQVHNEEDGIACRGLNMMRKVCLLPVGQASSTICE